MGMNHSRTKSFSFAFSGIKEAFKKEPNLRIHTVVAAVVIIAAILLGFGAIEFILLLFTIFFVLTLELLNTFLESLVNLVAPEIGPEAKAAKDISAAMVLFASILAVLVGAVLFVPKILNLLGQNVY
jgi:diacylglycerol kinase